MYDFQVTSQATVDITVRVSSQRNSKQLYLVLLDGKEGRLWNAPGNGWTDFEDYVWRDVDLTPGQHRVVIRFKTNQINVCSISVK
jgi:hypothetical protein